MRKTLTTLSAAALAVTMAMPAQAQDQAEEMELDTVVATVNGEDITLGHMLMVRTTLPEQYQQLGDDVLWDGILDQLVRQAALAQDENAVETKRVTLSIDNERRALLAGEVVKAIAETSVSDEAVQAAYEADYTDAEMGKEFNASHILVETEEDAQALVEELEGGADFAELAREKSTGPSGPNGGELGWFAAGMMVEPFQDAVETLEVGAVSEPVQTQFGWHVIKLNETRAKEAPALDEVRGEIEMSLQQQAVEKYIDETLASAEVTRMDKSEADVSALSNMQLLED
ncbi:peptidylprolyl isomerase [Salipiger bermudensis]|uniref:peptidylprolyl isomerase n=1 Tax=Salipiger bermudensis TaxID=344736 RepID=UPI001A8DF380|nr:peptidylprolyl isomerase [Salipiger bermudensis]MBN9676170.1 peptidylprolyl isomerase [Salipiger bermudensis]MBR9892088.1 peptidylprolyl isomerase [bacterium]MCA1287471.1 peptidylprolyl isomerase [Salipiger bermudensis]